MTTIEQEHDPTAIVAPYTNGVAQLEAAIPGLTESDLDIAQAASVWTIRQIIHHVIDGDDLWKVCIKAALGHSEGIFSLQWYCEKPQDKWVGVGTMQVGRLSHSLTLFRANRHQIDAYDYG